MLKRFLKDERGNFAMMFACAAMCMMACVGVAVDYSMMTSAKQKLQSSVDSSALAGAIVADKSTNTVRRAMVLETFSQNNLDTKSFKGGTLTRVDFDDSNALVSVDATAQVRPLFLKFLSKGDITVNASAVVSYAVEDVKPIALAFVLDVSGSMDSVIAGDTQKKIDALKAAAEELFIAVENGIGSKSSVEQVLQASLSSYNTQLVPGWTTAMRPERSSANGTSTPTGQTSRGVITTISAAGGTNSTPAIQDAYDKLVAAKNADAETQLFMLFMTDGNNNSPAEDPNTSAVCEQAKAQNVEVFTIAFDAPANGKSLLLQCASEAKGKKKGPSLSGCDKPNPPKKCVDIKQGYYFDASDAKKLKKAFKDIGDNIGEQHIIIKG